MKYPCVEATVDYNLDFYTIRLWINQTDVPQNDQEALRAREIIKSLKIRSRAEILNFLIENIPNLNAVQIKSGDVGVVIYTVDFENDPHG